MKIIIASILFIVSVNAQACRKWAGKVHPNGGGFIHQSAKVAESVYVPADSMVCGFSEITGNVRIEENSTVTHNAKISDNVIIRGGSYIGGNAQISGDIIVENGSKVTGTANLSGSRTISREAINN